MKKKFIALIPAREGSKGIKNKNVKLINGHPVIAYSILAAKKSKNISKVFVTTDGPNIAKISKKYGAEVIVRPKNLAKGNMRLEPSLIHAVEYLEKKNQLNFESIVLLQPTSIIRNKNDIDNAIKVFKNEKADSLFSSCDMHVFLWRKKFKTFINTEKRIQRVNRAISPLNPINYNFKNRKNRQELPEEYIENGSFYITKKKTLKKYRNRLGGKISTYSMNSLSIFEIDTKEDLKTISLFFSSGFAKKAKIIAP